MLDPHDGTGGPFRLLGLAIDNKLRMNLAIDKLFRKAKPKARALLRCERFYNVAEMLCLYKANVRSQTLLVKQPGLRIICMLRSICFSFVLRLICLICSCLVCSPATFVSIPSTLLGRFDFYLMDPSVNSLAWSVRSLVGIACGPFVGPSC